MLIRIIALILSLILFFVIAEFIGRRKHIGFWWSFFLLMGGFINGLIAILLSPSAKKEPTKGTKTHQVFGYISIIFLGIIPLITTIIEINSLFSPDLYFQLPNNYWDITRIYWSIRIGITISFILTGIYLIQLGRGKIYNNNPKYLSNEVGSRFSYIQNLLFKNDFKYYIIEEGKQSVSLSFEQLKEKEINEETLVWRKGLKDWIPAKNIKEIDSIINYTPPPIPKKNRVDNEPLINPTSLPILPSEKFDWIRPFIKNDETIDYPVLITTIIAMICIIWFFVVIMSFIIEPLIKGNETKNLTPWGSNYQIETNKNKSNFSTSAPAPLNNPSNAAPPAMNNPQQRTGTANQQVGQQKNIQPGVKVRIKTPPNTQNEVIQNAVINGQTIESDPNL